MSSFTSRTVFISGASRGIGKAIALKLAKEGANIIVAAKSVEEDSRLGGTIFSAAEEIEAAGGKALAVQVDIRDEAQIIAAVQKAVDRFGGIDVVINNASAISLTNTEKTEVKRFDLMQSINVRGTFLVVKHCLPYLKKGTNPHIITLSPPISLKPKWMGGHIAYTLTKYNMSMLALGWAAEFKSDGIASNALWPRTTIDTAAVRNLLGGEALANMSRTPEIIADSVYYILSKTGLAYTGNTFIDEEVLAKEGITNLDQYAVVPGGQLYPDLFVD
ncbi:NAD(P)-dependent oxidoreductase [Sediminibacterium sp.]|uniref:SDR family oxidoreductase n=1 Tax=Sediminibacterium sp. TaxID=1917865 RepID=UPI0027343550|nr:NAD(P)-dependent oxidoreductase [Sediminibacterium sp.]MDP3394681.1 NAD(P)-dependent oxidoreductase [Sediminibacterium sp.]MDP3568516.1 NAD(P)-dependent oxidoreductase [Sediminibacterium sp.]